MICSYTRIELLQIIFSMAVNTHPFSSMDNRRMLLPTNHIYFMVTPTYIVYFHQSISIKWVYIYLGVPSYTTYVACIRTTQLYYVIKTKSLKTTEKSPRSSPKNRMTGYLSLEHELRNKGKCMGNDIDQNLQLSMQKSL